MAQAPSAEPSKLLQEPTPVPTPPLFEPTPTPSPLDLNKKEELHRESAVVKTRVLEPGDNLIHGFSYYNGYLWASTRTSPARILRMNPDTLDYQRTILSSGLNDGEDLIAAAGYIWVILYTEPSRIIKVHPETLQWEVAVTFQRNELSWGGSLEYAFGYLWAGGRDRKIARINLTNMTYQIYHYGSVTSSSQFHALASGGGYIWASAPHYSWWQGLYADTIVRINPSNPADYALVYINTPMADDIVYVSGSLYTGSEASPCYIYKIANNLVYTNVYASDTGAYGIFMNHPNPNSVWGAYIGSPGTVVEFDSNLNVKATYTLPVGFNHANEIAFDIAGNMYVTCWESPAKIVKLGREGGVWLSLPFPHTHDENGLDRITSYFDHEYPLLPPVIGGSEPPGSGDTTLLFNGERRPGTLFDCDLGVNCYSGHDGYDFAYDLPKGTPILAAAEGEVTSGVDRYGANYVKIDHGRYQTVYWHLDEIWKSSGHVLAGEPIGSVGSTGYATGPHLHFGVYYDQNGNGVFETDEKIDPYGFDPTKTDPWTLTFTDARGRQHTGTPSTWLWEFSLPAQVSLSPESGDVLTSSDGVRVEVPAGAVSNPALLAFTIAPEPNSGTSAASTVGMLRPAASASTIATGQTFQLTAAYTDGTPLMTFATPVTIIVPYSDTDLTYGDEATLSLYRWEGSGASWTALMTTLDTLANQATATTDRPGLFSLRAQPFNPAPELLAISPSSAINTVETEIVVTGLNFLPTPWLNLGIAALDVHYVSPSTLTAIVPSLLAPGTYDLTLRNPDGQMVTLPDAFTVKTQIYLPIVMKNR